MREDRCNFAICCWKDLNDFPAMKKNAQQYKVKAK